MKVIVLCGASGSGKSTWAKENYPQGAVFSADHYFENKAKEEKKTYKEVFNPAELSKAHQSCLYHFTEQLVKKYVDVLVVDNTNTTILEIAPYASLALAYGCELEIIIFQTSSAQLIKLAHRNLHGVTPATLMSQMERLEKTIYQMPKWWNRRVVKVSV